MTQPDRVGWAAAAVIVGRLIFAAVFIMAVSFKLMDMDATADDIASAGFPLPKLLASLAALFELARIACFLSGAYFSEAVSMAETKCAGWRRDNVSVWPRAHPKSS